MLTIDGSQGEGGGQVLRTSLGLSLVTRTPFRIVKVRAGRARPGLMRQHLTAVKAAAVIGAAEVRGAELGSTELEFRPREVSAGEHTFSVGSAGSATLVFQTVLPALLRTSTPSVLVLEGGTHNPLAPCFDFLERTFLPLLARMGVAAHAVLERPGFYPAGGGRCRIALTPAATLAPLHLLERGELRARRATAIFSAIPFDVARRELAAVQEALGWDAAECVPREMRSSGPGNVLLLELESQHVTEVVTAYGDRGVSAETVAGKAIAEMQTYLAAGVPVGEHLADQLLLPLALAGGGSFRSLAPTLHTKTQLEVIRTFLDIRIDAAAVSEKEWHFEVH